MGETLYSEKRRGMTPDVQGLGGGSVAVNWTPTEPQTGIGRSLKALQIVLQAKAKAEESRQEKLKKQSDMYNVLRDSGYDPKSAHEAVQKNQFPGGPGEEGGKAALDQAKLQESQAGILKTQAETQKLQKQAEGYVDPLTQSKIDLNQAKAGRGDFLTPGQRLQKDRLTEKIYSAIEGNKPKREALRAAEEGFKRIPQGQYGQVNIEYLKRFDPSNPLLTDWQNIKEVLLDAQLQKVARTKGAISDAEMRLFSQAVANDDLASVARMKPILKRLKSSMDAEEAGLSGAYQRNYGEDPNTWFQEEGGEGSVQEFASEEEVMAANLPAGTTVKIAGRPARID